MGSTTETGAERKGSKGKGCQGKRGDFFRAHLLDGESNSDISSDSNIYAVCNFSIFHLYSENLNQELEKSGILRSSNPDDEQPWHNPIATKGGNSTNLYGTERDPNNCSFYLKTGACRFGERCSRQHPRPPVSQTLLIPNMFQDVRLMEVMLDEKDNDVELEFDEDELYSNFKDFYKDVLEEFRSVGQVQQFKVCCNFEPHLRGNVYIQYKSENDALNAYAKFNGRWYAGKQLSLQFSPVNKWKSAICGTFARNRCPRGKNCNFLHVFRNPNNEFKDADRDMWDSPAQSRKNSEREWRSSTRELERRWDRAESYSSERSRYSRESSSRDYWRRRKRSRSRSRERRRARSRSKENTPSSSHSHGRSSTKRNYHSSARSKDSRRPRSRSPDRKRKRTYIRSERERSNSSSDSHGESSDERGTSDRQVSLKKRSRKVNALKSTSKRNSDNEFVPEFDSE
ncbi:U2 small nuclear ribonucleoprotein auxiliary factor 35 kDa subunit-related protein 2-like isoform X2 [Rhopilema esculentum]|uniref:U2 small nuclear ribonucleoprotein auxiliary factor 35 kDa subunit-related protein 2-like isoform X2 n=1 Tax=Rhopilema esculentum TaxID=499914 RepID=UPI0031DA1415